MAGSVGNEESSSDSSMPSTESAITVCHFCELPRKPFVAYGLNGVLVETCRLCFAAKSILDMVPELPLTTSEVDVLAEAAEQVYTLVREYRNTLVAEVEIDESEPEP